MTRLASLIALGALLLAVDSVHAQSFEVVNLGAPGSTIWSSGHALTDDEVVVGRSGLPADRLFMWDPAGGIRDLNAPYPLHTFQQVRMNGAGRVAGLWNRGGVLRPFAWENGVFTELPDVAPGWTQMIHRLTDGGMLLFRGGRTSCGDQTAVLLGGVLYPVDHVLGSCWAARDIGDGPVVAGYRRNGSTYEAVVRLSSGQVLVPSPTVGAQAIRINSTGYSTGTNATNTRLWVASPEGGYSEGATPAGTTSLWPEGMNRFGEVVGNAYPTTGDPRPFLVRNGQLTELTTRFPGYTLSYLADVSDAGKLVGQARLPNGQYRAVLLRPTDRPQNLQASVTGSQVTLTWATPAGAPAGATFFLQVGSASAASNVFRGNIGAVSSISGAVPNGVYFARVTMVHPGGAFGAVSDEVRFAVPAVPAAPTGLAYSLAGRTLTLTWSPPVPGGAFEYIAEAGSSSGGVDIYNGSVGTAPTITTSVAPRTYFIRVRARNAAGISPPSNELVVVVP